MKTKKTLVIMLTLIMALGSLVSVNASVQQQNPVAVEIKPGEFSLKSLDVINFPGITLKDKAQQYTTSFQNGSFVVKDLRGTQAGWRVDVKASQLKSKSGATLPIGSLSLEGVSGIKRVGTGEGGSPTASLRGKSVIDAGTIEIMKAVPGAGMGVFEFDFARDALTISVDPTTARSAMTYESILTWDLVQAP